MAMNNLHYRLVPLLLVLLGLAARFSCSSGELWFDELWTVSMTRNLESAWQAITIPHDNRHPLTSFWVQYIPSTFPYWVFRIESLVFSIFTGAIFIAIVKTSQCRAQSLLWLLFYSTSYLFVLYDSEARGYAGMITSVVALYYFRERIFFSFSVTSLLYFTLLIILGVLSHALFITFLVPYVAWGWYTTIWSKGKWRSTKWATIASLSVILSIVVPLYAKMVIGGAPVLPYIQVIGSSLLLSIGGDSISPTNVEKVVWQLLFGMTFLILIAIELILWLKEERDEAFFVLLVTITPFLAVVIAQPHFILPRYFLIPILFIYLTFARLLKRLCSKGKFGTSLATVIILAFVCFNFRHIQHLYSTGRSSLGKTLSVIERENPRAIISGNLDFQMQIELPIHVTRNPALREFTFIPNYPERGREVDYILFEQIDRDDPSPETMTIQGVIFSKVAFWRAPPESGANLTLYRKNTGKISDS